MMLAAGAGLWLAGGRRALAQEGLGPFMPHDGGLLTTAGAGASQPVASNKTLEGRAQNRRVVLTRTDR